MSARVIPIHPAQESNRARAESIVQSARDAGVHVTIRQGPTGMVVTTDAPHVGNPALRHAAEQWFRARIHQNMELLQRFGFAPPTDHTLEFAITRDVRVPFSEDDPDMDHSWQSVPVRPDEREGWFIWEDRDRKTVWARHRDDDGGDA